VDLDGGRIVVTGADGFIGSHLSEALVTHGCNVTAFCLYNSFGSRGWLETIPAEIQGEMRMVLGDVRDPDMVRSALAGADAVFHLAALIGIPFSFHAPQSYVDTNVKGTLNVLQAARELGLSRVVVTSTSEVYGSAQYVPMDEKHPRHGQSPYSASKIAADAMAEAFYDSFDLPVVTVRPFNTYGPRQSTRAVIPTIVTQLLAGADEVHMGSLTPRRDFTYVADTCSGLIALGACDRALGLDVNLGTGQDIAIGELAAMIIEMTGSSARIVHEEERTRPDKSEVDRLQSDNALAQGLTGWRPEVPLREGLSRTIEWFAESPHGAGRPQKYAV
jgi:NAD dependent epimerase/dehydratase